MNRREFLIAVGAVPIVAYCASLPAAAPVLEDEYIDLMFKNLYPWQQRIWALLQEGKQVMYITGTQRAAHDTWALFNRHVKLHCSSIGSAFSGRGADLIIMDDFNDVQHSESAIERQHFEDWYNCVLRTRLYPKGKIEWVYT